MSNQLNKGAKNLRGVLSQNSGTIEGFVICKNGVIRKKKKNTKKT